MINPVRLFHTLIFLLMSVPLFADERIINFHSDITIFENAVMRVTEHITVRAEGVNIKRGIYRDFPTKYKDRYGNSYRVDFEIEQILRDGNTEPWHTEEKSNGVRIYIGKSDTLLDPGEYTYSISYRTYRQLGYFEEHDELYWNVTGNDWDFVIEKASALVQLPNNIPFENISAEGYTGITGSREQNLWLNVNIDDTVYFETTQPLPQQHGFTIVATWPKGYVYEPTREEKLNYLYQDNRHLFVGIAGLALLLAYYLLTWHRLGKDPEKGVVIPQYKPPKDYSPASMRFVEEMGYDHTCFAAAIINLAVKGLLTIKEKDNGDYTLISTGKTDIKMAPGESALLNTIFSEDTSLTLVQTNHSIISKAIEAHKNSLKNNYEKMYFVTNSSYFIIGILLTLVAITISLFSRGADSDPGAIFLVIWLTGWTFGVVIILKQVKTAWSAVKRKIWYVFPALFITAFAIPFVTAEIFVAWQLVQITSYSMVFLIIIAIALNWLFYELLKAPTHAGRQLLNQVEGFREYLELAEKQELEFKHPEGRCPALFEAYLPYALALGVEQQWGEKFADVLAQANTGDKTYSPGWYHGSHWNSANISGFTSSLGSSFTSAISSSSTAPGSSSGSGGGGSSGGGGGGGGGGGW